MLVVVCGVSGTGKSTIGARVAQALQIPFFDADDFHPESNVKKMQSGVPLNDEDRQPWLELLADNLAAWENQDGAVLACSALKEAYRRTLASKCNETINWIMLNGSPELLTDRLNSRKGHFFDPKLLSSQLDALELPEYGWTIDVALTPEEIVDNIVARLRAI